MKDVASPPRPNAFEASDNSRLESERGWSVLIVSSNPENRDALLHVFDGLPIDPFVAATIGEAEEVLSKNRIDVVFCDESLPDGSYRKILEPLTEAHSTTRFVVTLCTGEWEQYLDAMHLGATDVLRCPLQPVEVELVLIRAGQERNKHGFDVTA